MNKMYFQIQNTPERVRRARRKEINKQDEEVEEECPRLILAPFMKPPQVVFDNVIIGTTCEKNLELLNPTKNMQQITLGKALPPGLIIHLPGEYLDVEPETCYCLTMSWTPMQPTALRETLRFTNSNRGRYDVIVVLKSAVSVKTKNNRPKSKLSPGKIKKKTTKKSPVEGKKKEVIIKELKTFNVVQTTQYKVVNTRRIQEDISINESVNSNYKKCPFDSINSADLSNTTDFFSNVQRKDEFQQTFDISKNNYKISEQRNVLKPSNRQNCDTSDTSDIFDNLTFTPLKTLPLKKPLDKGPNIILSVNSDSDFNDSLDIKSENKENETHPVIIASSQPPNKWLTVHMQENNVHYVETPTMTSKKIPNTSSPTEFNSPNFSINTEFSRISDLSFCPHRFSTERKFLPKINNETHDVIDNSIKLNSDTYTKDSPFTLFNSEANQMYCEQKLPSREPPKVCRQSLFKEYPHREGLERRNFATQDHFLWLNDPRNYMRSPPRSLTPPLNSIPEESGYSQDIMQVSEKTNKEMETFTINRTYDDCDRSSMSVSRQTGWAKKAVRAEPELWKMPAILPKKSIKPKSLKGKESLTGLVNRTFESNKSYIHNSISHVDNVYSQSFTVDPFSSSTYFYDEQAVEKFETEFKRWLNYILTPPADLDSNIELKIDVGKAWLENRNREVPAAPTKEKVCSAYHNSQRLESLRRSARALLFSPEISQVLIKLNVQIDKKLIAIRNDRNLHLDVGLQKIIMELLLSYNPLWLRIGLEAIYGLVLPLKSNSDIEGLTTFIIQRMFKNPYFKNKHSKSSAPNMLLPAYMEAIKKFTLKKFFTLVFFLDQAKRKKLISHDPCLFCRNAVCKESREVIIRFTRELIAGIGDITRHLRPLGYVVCHKQSFLEEYKYAVHNIALDIKDGVRLTKVMEIILMKNGLLCQLRTPAISRLQKIHNVQVALNALKEANFVIVGDITAADIADGHREKTLSLLWQLIHVFRAPLFEKAANVIQMWWRKKYEVIVEKRKEEERILSERNTAASIIQFWWRQIQYNRLVKLQMLKVTTATTVIQKYCRMWICRLRYRKVKSCAVKVAQWYKDMKEIKKSKAILETLRLEKAMLIQQSATTIQTYVRRWLTRKRYEAVKRNTILIQSVVRAYLARKKYVTLVKTVLYIQRMFRRKVLMRRERKSFEDKKQSAILIQSYYRMFKERQHIKALKKSVQIIEQRYKAILSMRIERFKYLELKQTAIQIQSIYRGKIARRDYVRRRNCVIFLQTKIRAHQIMKRDRDNYLRVRYSIITLQKHLKSIILMRLERTKYLKLKQATVRIQSLYRCKIARRDFVRKRSCAICLQRKIRAHQAMKRDRDSYLRTRNSVIKLQKYFKSIILMRIERTKYLKIKQATINIQSFYRCRTIRREYVRKRTCVIYLQRKIRAHQAMKRDKDKYLRIRNSVITLQRYFKSIILMRIERTIYLKHKQAAVIIQSFFRCKMARRDYVQKRNYVIYLQRKIRAHQAMKRDRDNYLRIRNSVITLQRHLKAIILMRIERTKYLKLKQAAVEIQSFYRCQIARRDYIRKRNCVIYLQRKLRAHKTMKRDRENYLRIRDSAITLQIYFKSIILMRVERKNYLKLKQATIKIQAFYRCKTSRRDYVRKRNCIIYLQRKIRAHQAMKRDRDNYFRLRKSTIIVQNRFKSYLAMKKEHVKYITIRNSVTVIQKYFRSYLQMKHERIRYLLMKKSTILIQQRYRNLLLMRCGREAFLSLKKSVLLVQRRYKALVSMRSCKKRYQEVRDATVNLQRRYRAVMKMRQVRSEYIKVKSACLIIQRALRSYIEGKNQRQLYLEQKESAIKIQQWYRKCKILEKEQIREEKTIIIQSYMRMYTCSKKYNAMRAAVLSIQRYYRFYALAKQERERYLRLRRSTIKLQAHVRGLIQRKRYNRLKSAVLVVQAMYRFKRHKILLNKRKEGAAVCIQKYVRRYLVQSWYKRYIEKLKFVQTLWRSKLLTRLIRCDFLQKRSLILKLQAAIRGYLARKKIEMIKENLLREKEERRRHFAASRIQAVFRGYMVRKASDVHVKEMCRRWRNSVMESTQQTLHERNEEALAVLRGNDYDYEIWIRAFRTLEIIAEVLPSVYDTKASSIVRRVYLYISTTNRSISSVEVLKSAASLFVNLTRYRGTGSKIYHRDRIPPILKYMLRFSNSETQLFCMFATYLWLFSKYDEVKKDLTECLKMAENHKMMVTIKTNVKRMKRMSSNTRNKFSMNQSLRVKTNLLPALEPDYGLTRVDKPRYFEDPQHAITCLFNTYDL